MEEEVFPNVFAVGGLFWDGNDVGGGIEGDFGGGFDVGESLFRFLDGIGGFVEDFFSFSDLALHY